MKKSILYIDACARSNSRTRRLAESVLSCLDGTVTHLNLYEESLYPVDENAILQREQCVSCGSCEPDHLKYAKLFAAADEIIIAAPYWDLSFPSLLKVFMENVTVIGVTFAYTEQGEPYGLCRANRLIYVTTAGGDILDDSFGFGYIRALCNRFYGIHETEYLRAQRLDLVGENPESILQAAMDEASRRFGDGTHYEHATLFEPTAEEEQTENIICLN